MLVVLVRPVKQPGFPHGVTRRYRSHVQGTST